MRFDFVVIGAGISGITSAITLAQTGRSVCVIEKAPRIAPVVRGFARNGVRFDTGFHYTGGLGPGEPLDLFLRYLGVADRIQSFPFDPDGFDLFCCDSPEFQFRIPTGYRRIEEELCRAFPGERAAIASYLRQVREACAAMPYLNLDLGMDGNSVLQRVLGPTLKETLDALTGNETLKAVLSMHCLLYGVSSSEISFMQHATVVGTYYDSVRGIQGGGLSLAQALEARLAELGVELRLAAEATGIEVGAGREVCGVRLADGELIGCGAVVATLHPALLLDLVPEGAFRPAYRKRLAHLEDTISAFLCFGVTSEPVPSLGKVNRFLFPEPSCCESLGERPVAQAPLYLSAAYGVDDTPRGFVAICPAPFAESARWGATRRGARPEEYRLAKERALEGMLSRIERCCPEVSGKMVSVEGSSPLTVRDYCSSPSGGLYGAKHMVGQYNPGPTTRVPGLYLAGQGIVSPGVLGAALSGLLATGCILGHDQIRKELKACC
jgi:all-trans-retinol 13,14-reductase